MSVGDLTDAFAKLGRAQVHFEQLKADVIGYPNPHPEPHFSMRQEFDKDAGEVRFTVRRVREFPREWGLLIGDVLNNARTALDHLAWLLVQKGSIPEPDKDWLVQFPIHDSMDDFNANIARRLPGVSQRNIDAIRNRQPIPGNPHYAMVAPLTLLREYGRIDKHRELHAVIASEQGISVGIFSAADCKITAVHPGRDIEDVPFVFEVGMELMRADVADVGPQARVELKIEGQYAPSLPDGRELLPTLRSICDAVFFVVSAFDSEL